MVEVRQLTVMAAHASAAVEHEQDLLIALVLIFPRNGRAVPGRGFPVDLTQAVAFTKFAQLVKLQAQSPTRLLANADLPKPVFDAQQLPVLQPGEIRVHPDGVVVGHIMPGRPEAQRAAHEDLGPFEGKIPSTRRAQPIGQLGCALRAQDDVLRQVLGFVAGVRLRGAVIKKGHVQRAG